MAAGGRIGECRLCGATPVRLTDEDVYSSWLRRHVGSTLKTPDQLMPRKLIIRACHDCNGDLARKFEDPVAPLLKPLVLGEPVTFTPKQAQKVASWLWLKDIEYVLMRDVTYRHGSAVGPMTSAELHQFRGYLEVLRRTLAPPDGYVVRVGVIGHSADPLTLANDEQPFIRPDFLEVYSGITSFNHLGRAVFQTTLTGPRASKQLADDVLADNRTALMWPADDPVVLPTVRLRSTKSSVGGAS